MGWWIVCALESCPTWECKYCSESIGSLGVTGFSRTFGNLLTKTSLFETDLGFFDFGRQATHLKTSLRLSDFGRSTVHINVFRFLRDFRHDGDFGRGDFGEAPQNGH